MSEINAEPYFYEINSEVFGVVDALLEEASNGADSGYLDTIEDDVSELGEAYELVPEELEALGQEIARRLEVKSVLLRNDHGVYFVHFMIKPKDDRRI